MSRFWIVCASCQGTWPSMGTSSPYFEMELMTQPCPRCEAYTLRCMSAREGAAREIASTPLVEMGRSTEK